jgi:cytochrome c oxidase cbb3-type subunit 3
MVVIVCAVALFLICCERESRRFDTLNAQQAAVRSTEVGTAPPTRGERDAASAKPQNPFGGNAWAVGEGKRLFTFYNCAGCHANGGGGMGPALMDDHWIYGSQPAAIYQTIMDGRPNGMPAFRNRIPEAQVWMLVGFVQSLSGQLPIDVLPGRSDHMRYSTPENARRATVPRDRGKP